MGNVKYRNPWAWVPTLYFAQGIPYFLVTSTTTVPSDSVAATPYEK